MCTCNCSSECNCDADEQGGCHRADCPSVQWDRKEDKYVNAIVDLLEVMEMQEKRETEEFHISAHAFRPIWDEAKEQAKELIKPNTKTVQVEVKQKVLTVKCHCPICTKAADEYGEGVYEMGHAQRIKMIETMNYSHKSYSKKKT